MAQLVEQFTRNEQVAGSIPAISSNNKVVSVKKYVVFDFDDTLVKSLDYWYKTMDKLGFKDYGFKPVKGFDKLRKGKGNKEIAQAFLNVTKLNISPEEVQQNWAKHMQYFYSKKIKMLAGAYDYLLYLKNKGYKICIASATNIDLLKTAFQIFNISNLIDYVYSENSLGYAKHHSQFFTLLLEKLNCKPQDILFFEDSYVSLSNATKCGIDSVCIKTHYNKKYYDELKSKCKLVIKNYKNKQIYSLV